MSIVDIRWRPNSRELRKFGLVVLVGMGLLGLAFQFLLEQVNVAVVLYAVGAVLGLPGLTGTVVALPGYWLWMGFAFAVGNVTGRVLLTAIYYLLFSPLGGARRALGNDALQRKHQPTASYWSDLKTGDDPGRYERQF
jgi:hypothetical protein